MNWKAINWKALLKILAVGAAGGAVAKISEALGASGSDTLATVIPALSMIVAYLLKQPFEPKPKEPAK